MFEVEGRIQADHPSLPGHFPGNPIVPGVIILSEVETALRGFLGEGAALISLPSVKFLNLLRPEQRFRIALQQIDSSSVRFTVTLGETKIAVGMATCRSGTCSD